MKKSLILFLSLLLSSLACQTTNPAQQPTSATLTAPQAESTRVALVDKEQETFYTPDTWVSAPQSCAQSMVLVISIDQHSSSGTILVEERWIDQQGSTVWVYYLLVSNHGVGESISPTYTLIPGTNISPYQDYQTAYLNYAIINSTSGSVNIDAGILSIFSLTKIDRTGTEPLGLDKIKTGENVTEGSSPYFTFGYPAQTITAQFSVSSIQKIHKEFEPQIIVLNPVNTTTNAGSSGGATCDNQGNVIGITTGSNGGQPTVFNIVPLPQNITTQVNTAIEISHSILTTNNLTKAP